MAASLTQVASSPLPTQFGDFTIIIYQNQSPEPYVILSYGQPQDNNIPLVRVHSQCLTGESFNSLKCDCKAQLDQAMQQIAKSGWGYIIYLFQEGRGIGLIDKIRAYALQDQQGLDTVEANLALGHPADARDFTVAAHILNHLNIKQIKLLTNNPNKLKSLEQNGVTVATRIPLEIKPNHINQTYLSAKKLRLNHQLTHV